MKSLSTYDSKTHLYGRIWMAAALIMMCFIPVVSGIIVGSGPDWGAFFKAFIALSVIYLPTAIGEVMIYTPIIGNDAAYLSFVTGNLSNLKIPCAVNALDVTQTEHGTEEASIISTISIAVSSIVTVLIIAIGVFFLSISGLTEFLESDKAAFLTPAFETVAFALFGALGGKYLIKYPKIALWPLAGITALCIVLNLIPAAASIATAGNMLFVGVIFCFLNARRLYYKKCKAEDDALNAESDTEETDNGDAAPDEPDADANESGQSKDESSAEERSSADHSDGEATPPEVL